MDGRNRHHPMGRAPLPPHQHILLHQDPRGPHRPHPAVLEERIVAQHHEIQALLLDNQRLGSVHVGLKQELSAADHEFRRMSAAASKIKAERDAEVHHVHEKALQVEVEARGVNAMNAELAQVKEDIQKIDEARLGMKAELQALNKELARVKAELQHMPVIKGEIETMHQELQKGRAAIKYEKKAQADNLEHSESMEKSMVVMANEVEKLRGELANAEKRARAAAAAAAAANPTGPVYAGSYGTTEMGFGGSFYADPYNMTKALRLRLAPSESVVDWLIAWPALQSQLKVRKLVCNLLRSVTHQNENGQHPSSSTLCSSRLRISLCRASKAYRGRMEGDQRHERSTRPRNRRIAVTEHNEEAQTDLRFVCVVKGEYQVVAGINYRLIITAKDGSEWNDYEAVVWEKLQGSKELTYFKPAYGIVYVIN